MTYIALFPPEILALQEELKHHPELQERLAQQPTNELEMRMAVICAYCEVILDGYYDMNDMINLAKICYERLQNKRLIIVSAMPNH